LWNHDYFRQSYITNVPSLRDFCIRTCVQLLQQDSLKIEASQYQPGDRSKHDFLRCKAHDKDRIMYVANRLDLLSLPRVYRRFCSTKIQSRLEKVMQHQYIGISWSVDHANLLQIMQPPDNSRPVWKVKNVVVLHHPLLFEYDTQKNNHEELLQTFKQTLRTINRQRPNVVIVTGSSTLDPSIKKLLSKVNESISLFINNGTNFFMSWMMSL